MMTRCLSLFLALAFALSCQPAIIEGGDEPTGDTAGDADSAGDADFGDAAGDPTPPEPGYYLRGAAVVTATRETPLSGYAVVVRGELITEVAPEVTSVPAELEVVDMTGMTLMPGLIDNHVHIATGQLDVMDQIMDVFLDGGVTTARDVCSIQDEILTLRDNIAAGNREGPRIFTSGAAYTAPGGHPEVTIWPSDPDIVEGALRLVDDPILARAEVDLSYAAGVDLIKAVVTDCSGGCVPLDPAVLDAIVDQAHQHGLQVAVHTNTPDDVDDAIAAGADTIEHGFTHGDPRTDQIEALIANDMAVVPTLSLARSNPSGLATLEGRLSTLREAGVRIVAGTDSQNALDYGDSLHEELGFMVDAGFTPMEAIIAATQLGADLVGHGDDFGTIEAGKIADLIAVNGDPTTDITAVVDVTYVFVRGEMIRPPF